MQQEYANKLLALQATAKSDETYLSLLAEYRASDAPFLRALEEMAPPHRSAVMDYIAAVHAVNHRLLELALASGEKS
ncbi:MAG: hypothetical protein IJW14_03165 [Oscillospiraceae bacterium]|nr:hypothetical protein [Oscillospiraceae bacterium]